MAVEIDVVYDGQLHCSATHGPSGATLSTDAPVDNHGRGESFSPTDLVATALGACLMTIMGIVAERNNIDLAGTKVRVVKEMVQQPVRRIGTLRVTIQVANGSRLSEVDRTKLENAARHCPVHQSLHPDIAMPMEFHYL
ncbi:MAG: OsmC family protein [Planctomycetota bacterium]